MPDMTTREYWRYLASLLLLILLAGCAGQDMKTQDDGGQDALSLERALILANARQALGIPYRYGGASPSGVDCSGLVAMVYGKAGIQVPRTARQQFTRLPSRDSARPGDLLFFGSGSKATHVGIYLGNRQMIHAPGRGRSVTVTSLDIDYWHRRYLGSAGPAP